MSYVILNNETHLYHLTIKKKQPQLLTSVAKQEYTLGIMFEHTIGTGTGPLFITHSHTSTQDLPIHFVAQIIHTRLAPGHSFEIVFFEMTNHPSIRRTTYVFSPLLTPEDIQSDDIRPAQPYAKCKTKILESLTELNRTV